MPLNFPKIRGLFSAGLMLSILSSCYHPPYNNFKPDSRTAHKAGAGATFGAGLGAVASGTLTGAALGGVIGGTVGAVIGIHKNTQPALVKELRKQSIDFYQYGDTMTLVIPTDKYFMFNSPRLNELCYPGLTNVIRLLKLYPKSPIYVAAFTDNLGSTRHKKLLTQAQAETMLTYLWANNIKAYRLKAEGYGDKNTVADNAWIHGSAQNRRIEIQWFTGLVAQKQAPVFYTK